MKKLLFIISTAMLFFACSKDAAQEAATGGKSGSITRFALYQHFMYVLNLNEVQTYDIQDKEHPVLVNRLSTDYGLETITIYDNTAFLGSTTALYILDIQTDPSKPTILSKSNRFEDIGFSGCDPVAVQGNYDYSTIKVIENNCGSISAESALVVYNITNKSAPVVVGLYPLSLPNGLGIKDHYLFVCDEGTDQLIVFDISNPVSVTYTNYSIPLLDPVDLIVDGERMIVSSKTNFYIFDISDITQIGKIGQISK